MLNKIYEFWTIVHYQCADVLWNETNVRILKALTANADFRQNKSIR